MRKRLIPLIALLTMLAIVAAAYSVAISLGSTDIDQLGATGKVSVSCPVSECSISRVKWVIADPPYMVDQVVVKWDAADDTATYTVYVELYDDTLTLISSGSKTGQGGTGVIETTVDVDPNVDPYDVYYVRIVIVQE
jgi:hypothetical protein